MSGKCSPGESDDQDAGKALEQKPKVDADAGTKVDAKASESAPVEKVEGQ